MSTRTFALLFGIVFLAVGVAGALVRFAGRGALTDAAGRATIVRRLTRARVLRTTTSKAGYEPGLNRVRVRRRSR